MLSIGAFERLLLPLHPRDPPDPSIYPSLRFNPAIISILSDDLYRTTAQILSGRFHILHLCSHAYIDTGHLAAHTPNPFQVRFPTSRHTALEAVPSLSVSPAAKLP
ncbi:hypothetical protein FRB94_007927 [Tulasnella sp. JGI-2019a]|nr:hypothetical protein FRB93_012145 [Tulasnella sp. JGI-2019a]KAG9011694.1 hypothetical protein FRB94_007927 [Tulasnella sp. JGI-2019a]